MDVTTSTRAATALASLEAVPKILSIHEVQRAPISSPAGTTPRFSTTPPTPGSPEMSRVNSARRLGDDVVALEDPPMEDVGTDVTKVGSPRVTRPEKVDFLSEFDPFADTDQRTTPSAEGFAELDLAAELCAAFESSAAPGRIETPREEAVARPQRLIAELPERSQVPSDVPDAQVPEVQQVTERPPRLVAELSQTSQAPEEPSHASRLVAELSAPRSRQVAGTTLRPLPDGCELDAPSLDLSEARGRRWEEGQHRRGRSLDASVRDSALDLRRSIPQTWDIQEVRDVGASSQLRSRSVEDVRSQEAALARVFPMPEVEAPSALQAWKPQDAFIAQEVLQGFYRFMQQGDLLLLDAPGQAYLKYCEANSQHEESVGSKSGDAFHGMARSLSLATERVCFEHGVPATREERLDLALMMLESAITHGCKRLGQARSDPTLNNLRLYRADRFAALMEHVPATGLDALAMTASTGVQQLAAVAGIQPLSLIPSPPPAAPTTLMVPAVPMGAPPEMELEAMESVELFDDVAVVEGSDCEVESESGSSNPDDDDASSSAFEGDGDDGSEDEQNERFSESAASESSDDEEATPKGAWDSLMALFWW